MRSDYDSGVILGISDSHDSGVALIRGGQIIAAVNEERITRRKMAGGLPHRGLQEIWKIAGISPEQVMGVGIAGIASLGTPPLNNDFSDDSGKVSASQTVAELIDRAPGGEYLLAGSWPN